MNRTSRNTLLLTLLFAFSFIYRIAVMLRQTFPPGADIGLHNSIIYSITQSGNTDFLYNYFHMGGGSSVTFPGYHIFTSYVMLLTGLPDYVAHALVVSLFSSLIVLMAFLLTRKAWGASAGLLVAFLLAVSRFDMEMLMWGGYPNVITLMLIPLAFYLFLQKDKLSLGPFLVSASLISGAIFLTHSLSSVMFIVITAFTVFFGTLLAKHTGERRMSLFVWIVPLILGAIVIFPFLIQVAPEYLSAEASTFTGGVSAIRLALLQTKVLPLDLVIPLFACVFLFFLYSRRYIGKFLSVPALLMFFWTLIPAILTQGYLYGLYTDYNRFLYFVIFPVVTLIGVTVFHGAEFFAEASDWLLKIAKNTPQMRMNKYKTLTRLMPHLTRRNLLAVFVTCFMVAAFLLVPVFVVPSKGIEVQEFYQLMNQPEYEAIQWAQTNTPSTSVFVTDAQYGWWFGGFGQRRTIGAVEPQYLTNPREFEPAKVALNVLDTDYIIDNGLLQIREDGGYVARHNPEFLAKLNDSYFPYPFFNFNNEGTIVSLTDANGADQPIKLSNVPVIEPMALINNNESATIVIKWGNEFFNFTQQTTLNKGMQFAKMTATIECINENVTMHSVRFLLHTKGVPKQGENDTVIGYVDLNMKVVGQLLFTQEQPILEDITPENHAALGMTYLLNGRGSIELSFYAGVYQYEDVGLATDMSEAQQTAQFKEMLASHARTYNQVFSDAPLDVFDYVEGLREQNVDFIAVRQSDSIPRFAKDPIFSLVFINNDVAIFQVHENLS